MSALWGYGAYVPRYRLPATEVSRVWEGGEGALPVKEKAVPGLDEGRGDHVARGGAERAGARSG